MTQSLQTDRKNIRQALKPGIFYEKINEEYVDPYCATEHPLFECRDEKRIREGILQRKSVLESAPREVLQRPLPLSGPHSFKKFAAHAKQCCVSEGGKSKVGFVRFYPIKNASFRWMPLGQRDS
jgi:hypothetical protein